MRIFFTGLLVCIITCSDAQLPRIESNELILEKAVSFKTGTSELTDEGKAALVPVKDFLVAKEYVTLLRIEGHTDNTNNEAVSQKLTEQRAVAVCNWLAANSIDCKRLIAVGFGSTKPAEVNDTPDGRAKNQRMVFSIASLRGRLIGGLPADGGGKVAADICRQ